MRMEEGPQQSCEFYEICENRENCEISQIAKFCKNRHRNINEVEGGPSTKLRILMFIYTKSNINFTFKD